MATVEDPQFTFYQVGDVVYPLDAVSSNTALLEVCDPALFHIINYLAFEIDDKLGAVLTSATGRGNPPVGANIRKKLWVNPLENVEKADQVAFPLFAVWRGDSKMAGKTLNWRQDKNEMGWCYALPAMTLEQSLRFAPVLHSVVTIVNESLFQGFSPGYNDGMKIIGGNNIASAKCIEVRYGVMHVGDQTDVHFHSVFGKIEVIEQTMPNTTGLVDLEGTDFTVTDMKSDTDLPYENEIPKVRMTSENGP
jgi:hypothetical protein